MKQVWAGVMLVLLVLWQGAGIAATNDPQTMVRDTAEKVLAEVTANKERLEKDPSGIYSLVQESVLPHFDFRKMSQSAMGRFWRDASEDQKSRLTAEFKELLVRTYAVALLNYSGQTIEYLPSRIRDGDTEGVVLTRIQAGGPPIPINYRLHVREGAWKVYDVVIDGVSLVSNYRSTFASQIRRGGIDGLIDQLAARNRELRG